MTTTGYNGHKNWNYWNVSLWLHNDEGLYREMKFCLRREHNKDRAAQALCETLRELGLTHTPDGAPYSKSAIRAAMVGE